ncbi:DNA-directed RNA polymerases II 24 kDa polypeptide (RNA polymerase II subunit 5) [Elasticomyces elasticus]|nr:DNA-directed RNA polymerases II 24 kDa polypeptide (RNA polymerase II subunit 5) [Elasticomyces elasticus]
MSDDENARELSRMWRIWRTAKQMCYDRGYLMSDEEMNISLEEFHARCTDSNGAPQRASMNFTARPSDAMLKKYTDLPRPGRPIPEPSIGTIHFDFNSDPNVGVKHLRAYAQLCLNQNFHTGIFVSAVPVTSSALKILPAILPQKIEVFQESDLLVNITRHELVPKHVLLSPEEKKSLLERYRLKETQLPRIRVDDPVAKYLGLRRGQVVKIIRKSETAGRYASYRWCI